MKPLTEYRFGIGPMSKNVVDACISYANRNDVGLMLIPSRRQVEYDGGYSNRWTTEAFSRYVRDLTDNILLVRDHGGPQQGRLPDNSWLTSFDHDCQFLDVIHIDPWFAAKDFLDGCELTRNLIHYCYHKNPAIQYEIGTEQSIWKYDASLLDLLISFLKDKLGADRFGQIKYAVVQCGTALRDNINIGTYDRARLVEMLGVCCKYGLLAKEHNGDWVSPKLLREKLAVGLDAVNIAPEFGQIETQTYLNEIGDNLKLYYWYESICLKSEKWKKWFAPASFPRPEEMIKACGHYVISYPEFIEKVKSKLRSDIDDLVQANVIKKLDQLYEPTS